MGCGIGIEHKIFNRSPFGRSCPFSGILVYPVSRGIGDDSDILVGDLPAAPGSIVPVSISPVFGSPDSIGLAAGSDSISSVPGCSGFVGPVPGSPISSSPIPVIYTSCPWCCLLLCGLHIPFDSVCYIDSVRRRPVCQNLGNCSPVEKQGHLISHNQEHQRHSASHE